MNMNSAADSEGFPPLFCNAERPSRAISYAFPFRPSSRKIYRETDNRLSTWETTGLCRRSRPRHHDAGAEDSGRRRRLRTKRLSFFYPSVVGLSLFHLQMSSFISSVVTLSLFYLQSFPSIPLLLLYLFFNCNCFFYSLCRCSIPFPLANVFFYFFCRCSIPFPFVIVFFYLLCCCSISLSFATVFFYSLRRCSTSFPFSIVFFYPSAVALSLIHLQLSFLFPLLLSYPFSICNCLLLSLCCDSIPFFPCVHLPCPAPYKTIPLTVWTDMYARNHLHTCVHTKTNRHTFTHARLKHGS